MKTLETTFVSSAGGFQNEPLTYNQIARNEKFAVYQRSRDNIVKDYEVFEIRIIPKGKVNKFPGGIVTVQEDDTEQYATTSFWGKIAWSFGNKTAAMDKFNALVTGAIPLVETNDAGEVTDDAETSPISQPGRRGRAPKERKELVIPEGKFSVNDLATQNDVEYVDASFVIKAGLENNTIKFVCEERRNAKGKPTRLYSKI